MSCKFDPCGVTEMIAGSRRKLSFSILEDNDTTFNMDLYEARFVMSYVPNQSMSPVIEKSMLAELDSSGNKTGVMYVILDSSDTYMLNGKFVYQIIVYNSTTRQADIPYQGELLIYENVGKIFMKQLAEGE